MTILTLSDHLSKKQNGFYDPDVSSADMRHVASVILGGGEGTRLYPLTLTRCKPAINFGGKYRLIDVPISNSIHANCHKIFVITQFLSSSLHHHIYQTYMQAGANGGLVEILTAEQKPAQRTWFQGTADAVRQNMDYLLESPVEYFLILSGDQLYNINFKEMLAFAKVTDADVVIAALPVSAHDATRMGILKVNEDNYITQFYEKPQEKALLQKLRSSTEVIKRAIHSTINNRHYLGSMGIYLFKREVLIALLLKDRREDFGKHLIPTQLKKGGVAAFLYDGYWKDIGTIETFYEANMALTKPQPQFSFHNENRPIYSYRYDLPPAKFVNTQISNSILCEGVVVEGDEITRSILGPRTVIHNGAIVRHSYIMGNDYYESSVDHYRLPPNPHIGENCIICDTIVDKNATIGDGVQLINKKKLSYYNGENIFIRDGVIIVPRGARIPDGFII